MCFFILSTFPIFIFLEPYKKDKSSNIPVMLANICILPSWKIFVQIGSYLPMETSHTTNF